jgi:hypothetical protein
MTLFSLKHSVKWFILPLFELSCLLMLCMADHFVNLMLKMHLCMAFFYIEKVYMEQPARYIDL